MIWPLLSFALLSIHGVSTVLALSVSVSTVARSMMDVRDLTLDAKGHVVFVSVSYSSVYQLSENDTMLLLAGSGITEVQGAYVDGAGTVARFFQPAGITSNIERNAARMSVTEVTS